MCVFVMPTTMHVRDSVLARSLMDKHVIHGMIAMTNVKVEPVPMAGVCKQLRINSGKQTKTKYPGKFLVTASGGFLLTASFLFQTLIIFVCVT